MSIANRKSFKFDDEGLLEARYAHRCFAIGDGDWGDAVGGEGWDGSDFHGGGDNPDTPDTPDAPEDDARNDGNEDDVGDGIEASRCEAAGGVWDTNTNTCKMPDAPDDDDDDDDDPGGGGGGGGGDKKKPENEADIKFAKLLRQQWDDYKKRWLPVEKQMSKTLTDDNFGEDVVNKARQAGLAMDSADQTVRQLDRYGVELGTRQKQALMGSATKDRYAQAVGGANKTRAGMVDLKDALQKDMIGIGQGVGASATAGLGQSASMEISRAATISQMQNQHAYMQANLGMQNQMYQQQMKYAGKQQKSGLFGLIGTAVGGSLFGPVGAMIGGGLGSMIG